jgi:hypothetical protein
MALLVIPAVTAYMKAATGDDPMLPSFFKSDEGARPWNVPRAGLYGAGIGLVAALFKIFGPFHAAEKALPSALEVCVAVAAFALLCAGAALLRNLLARRLWETPH